MTISRLLVVAALIVFVLVALGVTLGSLNALELTAAGLALFAAAHL